MVSAKDAFKKIVWYTTNMTGTDLVPRRARQKPEKKKMMVEAAALAYVQMMHGDYKYPEGARRGRVQEDGQRINKAELMRRAGYRGKSLEKFDEFLADDEYFNQMIELFEIRYTDPHFSKEREGELFKEVGNEALKSIYEQLKYTPHSLTIDQHVKIVKLVLDAGVTFSKIKSEEKSKAEKLLETIKDPEKKKALMDDYKHKLLGELEEIEKLEGNV